MATDIVKLEDTLNVNVNVGGGAGGAGAAAAPAARQAAAVRRLSRAITRFHGEFLTLLFTGMAINRLFEQHVQSTWELTGATKMLAATMKMSLLPVMLPLSQVFMGFLSSMMAAPPIIKAVSGAMILLATVLGWGMQFMGMFLLAIFAVISILSVMIEVIQALVIIITTGLSLVGLILLVLVLAFVALLAGIILAVLIAAALFVLAWIFARDKVKKIWDNLSENFENLMGDLEKAWKGLSKVIIGLLTGDTDEFLEGMGELIDGIIGGIMHATILAIDLLLDFFEGLFDLWTRLGEKVATVGENLVARGLDYFGVGGVADFFGLDRGRGGAGDTVNNNTNINVASGGDNTLATRIGNELDNILTTNMRARG